MFSQQDLIRLLYLAPLVLFSLSFHELAHGFIAYKMGDSTAKSQGRLSLNPLAHLDPVGTLMLLISMLSGFGIGWAKPVPIDTGNFRSPRKGFLLVSLAGPASNFLLAILFGSILRFLGPAIFSNAIITTILAMGTVMNLSLAVFNLIPIPPLDGSRIILYFLRGQALNFWLQIERYRFVVIIAIIFLSGNILHIIVGTPVNFLFKLITGFSLG